MFDVNNSGSEGQRRIYEFVKQLYPQYKIIWEQSIDSLGLRFDIFVREIGLALEVDGIQHDKFNPFFHKTVADLKRGYRNDKDKDYFCEVNGIKLIRLKYKEALKISLDGLKDRIEQTAYPEGIYVYSCLL